ncbi:MAG: alpha/beta hydrolase [Bifidobacteriaceae bacterium]|nr:alpha/beta hydrolase [Bifidobacteriaceae bacterium]
MSKRIRPNYVPEDMPDVPYASSFSADASTAIIDSVPVERIEPLPEESYADLMDRFILPVLARCRHDLWTPVEGDFVPIEDVGPETRSGIHSVLYSGADFVRCLSFVARCRADGELGAVTLDELPLQREYPDIVHSRKKKTAGTIVVSMGFIESEIKFRELTWYFLQFGFDVLVVEHRGQGYSSRETSDPNVQSMTDWRNYETDFVAALRQARRVFNLPSPLLLYGHSMGAAIAAAIEEDYSDLFTRAVLSAPMMMPQLKAPATVLYPVVAALVAAGKGKERVFSFPDFNPDSASKDKGASSLARLSWYYAHRAGDPHWHLSSPSYDWGLAALRMDRYVLSPHNVRRIAVPTLLFQAGLDSWVRPSAENLFVDEARRSGVPIRFYNVPQGRHELFFEKPPILAKYLGTLLGFFLTASR